MSDAPDRITVAPPPAQGEGTGTRPPGEPATTGAAWGTTTEQPSTYVPISLLAIAGIVLAAIYAVLVAIGGVAIVATRHPRKLIALTILVPLVAVIIATGMRVSRNSLGTVVGLSLAGFYALVGLAGLVGFSGTNPWMLPGWTLLLPIGTALLCWLARVRISQSEGTLGGSELARWGLGLSLCFGLLYLAYMAAGTFAVRQQAADFSRQWLDLIRQGEMDQAFLLTLSPTARPAPDAPDLRESIEAQFNIPRGPDNGPYSNFLRSVFVRAIQMGGPETTCELTGITPDFDQGMYKVKCQYHVTTIYADFDLILLVQGTETGKAGASRVWQIMMDVTGMTDAPQYTQAGRELIAAASAAGPLMVDFRKALEEHDIDRAYGLTLPEDQRAQRQEMAIATLTGLTGPAGRPATNTYLAGRAKFMAGDFIAFGPKFWAGKAYRQTVIDEMKTVFTPNGWAVRFLTAPRQQVPSWEVKDGLTMVKFTETVSLPEPAGPPKYMMEVDIIVGAEGNPETISGSTWRVRGFELLRARTAPREGRLQPGMGAPR